MQRNINPRTNKTASTITKIIHHVNSHRNPLQYSIPLQSWSKTQTSSGSINLICLFSRYWLEGDAVNMQVMIYNVNFEYEIFNELDLILEYDYGAYPLME